MTQRSAIRVERRIKNVNQKSSLTVLHQPRVFCVWWQLLPLTTVAVPSAGKWLALRLVRGEGENQAQTLCQVCFSSRNSSLGSACCIIYHNVWAPTDRPCRDYVLIYWDLRAISFEELDISERDETNTVNVSLPLHGSLVMHTMSACLHSRTFTTTDSGHSWKTVWGWRHANLWPKAEGECRTEQTAFCEVSFRYK